MRVGHQPGDDRPDPARQRRRTRPPHRIRADPRRAGPSTGHRQRRHRHPHLHPPALHRPRHRTPHHHGQPTPTVPTRSATVPARPRPHLPHPLVRRPHPRLRPPHPPRRRRPHHHRQRAGPVHRRATTPNRHPAGFPNPTPTAPSTSPSPPDTTTQAHHPHHRDHGPGRTSPTPNTDSPRSSSGPRPRSVANATRVHHHPGSMQPTAPHRTSSQRHSDLKAVAMARSGRSCLGIRCAAALVVAVVLAGCAVPATGALGSAPVSSPVGVVNCVVEDAADRTPGGSHLDRAIKSTAPSSSKPSVGSSGPAPKISSIAGVPVSVPQSAAAKKAFALAAAEAHRSARPGRPAGGSGDDRSSAGETGRVCNGYTGQRFADRRRLILGRADVAARERQLDRCACASRTRGGLRFPRRRWAGPRRHHHRSWLHRLRRPSLDRGNTARISGRGRQPPLPLAGRGPNHLARPDTGSGASDGTDAAGHRRRSVPGHRQGFQRRLQPRRRTRHRAAADRSPDGGADLQIRRWQRKAVLPARIDTAHRWVGR